jgi:uncharacterized protein (DUF433 family)
MKQCVQDHSALVMRGKPCIRGLSVAGGALIKRLSSGYAVEASLFTYPHLDGKHNPRLHRIT